MGLVATVRCRCFSEGRAVLPDFDANLLKEEPDGRLVLDLPQTMDDVCKTQLKEAKVAWERDCCVHPWRYEFNEWVASWPGIRMLRHAMQAIGSEDFPVLLAQLPYINAGQVRAKECQKALDELDWFEAKLAQGLHQITMLQDSTAGRELYVSDFLQGGCFYMAPAGELWLKAGRFYVIAAGMGLSGQDGHDNELLPGESARTVLFESASFTQKLVTDSQTGACETVLTDLQSGQTLRVAGDMTIRNVQAPDVVVTTLGVLTRVSCPDDYAYILKPLRQALHASVQTSHPLVWG